MPISLEPGQKYPVVLDCDQDKPEATRPTFYAKSQSMRGQQKVGEVLDMWAENDKLTLAQLFDATVDVLSNVILGWANMGGIEYSAEALRDVLTFQEARELLRKVMYNQHVTPEEKKSLEQPH
jgi:hypothetical protein